MEVANVTSQEDGAGEKLVDEKNGHNSKGVEVKYVSPSNGEAKIDIENLKTAFAGMGKEELMKYANDPFWVRMRWFLFIVFWLLWFVMLGGAIAIIVLAPKCDPPAPREWWEESPFYKVDVGSFSKDTTLIKGDLKGFTTKLDYLSSLGVKTIVLSNILKVSDKKADGIDEFKTVAPSYGTLDDFKALISSAKEKGLKVLLTLVPNHSSLKNVFFNKSALGEEPYSSYYVWGPSKGFSADGHQVPPNNWLSKNGGSAWEWNEVKKQFYLHQFDSDEPEFNFNNPAVLNYFNEVMQFWLAQGVSGFYIERAAYLLEDPDLRNETFVTKPSDSRDIGIATHMDYAFYDHTYTANLPGLTTLLRSWKGLVTNSSGILVVDDVAVTDRSVAHLVVKSQALDPYPEFSAEGMKKLINSTLVANPWPAWQVQVKNEPEGTELAQGMLLSTMLLPGTPVTLAGQELGLSSLQEIPWDDSSDGRGQDVKTQQKNSHSIYNAYKELVEARKSNSILHGSLQLEVINGTSLLAYTRIKSGNPGYLVVFNTGSEEALMDTTQLPQVPEELTVLVVRDTSSIGNKTRVYSKDVLLPGRAVAIFRFVPKENK